MGATARRRRRIDSVFFLRKPLVALSSPRDSEKVRPYVKAARVVPRGLRLTVACSDRTLASSERVANYAFDNFQGLTSVINNGCGCPYSSVSSVSIPCVVVGRR